MLFAGGIHAPDCISSSKQMIRETEQGRVCLHCYKWQLNKEFVHIVANGTPLSQPRGDRAAARGGAARAAAGLTARLEVWRCRAGRREGAAPNSGRGSSGWAVENARTKGPTKGALDRHLPPPPAPVSPQQSPWSPQRQPAGGQQGPAGSLGGSSSRIPAAGPSSSIALLRNPPPTPPGRRTSPVPPR